MNWSTQCAVVIPCHNEAATISQLVTEVRRHLHTAIVVDDGSTDATSSLAEAAGATVLRHPQATGKGAALASGWQHAAELGFPWALCMDGDGQHAPADIPNFLAAGDMADVVVGNRMANAAKMPWVRRQVNRWMSARLSAVAGQPLPDSQCGFRLMRLEAWRGISLETRHFEVESELLIQFSLAGHRVKFVPIQVIYKNERSKIRPLADTLRWFRWWNQMRLTVRRHHRTVNRPAVSTPTSG